MMTSRERVITTLQHKEPDRVPFDLGSTLTTGITKIAYQNLLKHLGINGRQVVLCDVVQQLATVDEDVLQRLQVDTRGLEPKDPSNWKLVIRDAGNYTQFVDQFGITWAMPKEGGFYYDMVAHPLHDRTEDAVDQYPWPKGDDPARVKGLRQEAERLRQETPAAIVMGPMTGGPFEMASWMRGYDAFYPDLVDNPRYVCKIMDKMMEIRYGYWEVVLEEMGDIIDVVLETEDLGGQWGTLVSTQMYRQFIKPLQKELYSFIKKRTRAFILMHSCGSIYDVIPDLIEVGVDILNPVQVSAAKMDTKQLKREFGKDLSFWGGGVDTQWVLPHGTPQQVKDEVKRRIEDLAPGGGFVFNTVHNIQADVPPENVMAMWEAIQEYGVY